MEKSYERPEAQVVRYQKRVKTDTEFTDSGGVQRLGIFCPFCNKLIFAVRAADVDWNDPDAIDALFDPYTAACGAHAKVCPNWPADFTYKDFKY